MNIAYRLHVLSATAACLASAILTSTAAQAKFEANYDESKMPAYTLPDALKLEDGTPVEDPKTWTTQRRPEILRLFETYMYGKSPKPQRKIRYKVTTVDPQALGGLATRKEVSIALTGNWDEPVMHLLLYIPNNAPRPCPAFLGLSFGGNHAVTTEPTVTIHEEWTRDQSGSLVLRKPDDSTRGKEASRWQVELLIKRGYALATAHYGDIEPDHPNGWTKGIRARLNRTKGQPAEPDEWGAIGAWAYGLSRALDYLSKDKAVDAKRVIVVGHSRLGKTALWAGAQDERFAAVISNDSGCGGAALSRRIYGETVGRINTAFPHWFCDNFKKYNERENDLPIDQHQLIGLIAPRPVYVASAEEDRWADPKGEFISTMLAGSVYELLGIPGLTAIDMPPIHKPVGKRIRYHIRAGKHDVTAYDWEQYLTFADEELPDRGKKVK